MIEDRRPVEHMNRRMLDGFLPTSSNVEVDGDDRRVGEDDPIRRDRILQDMAIRRLVMPNTLRSKGLVVDSS